MTNIKTNDTIGHSTGEFFMGLEVEHKFLMLSDAWLQHRATIHEIRQGYISKSNGNTTRIRIYDKPRRKAVLCIKGTNTNDGVPEFEYTIPVLAEAEAMLLLCKKIVIEKKRHHIKYEGFIFEVDEFFGPLKGKVLIEVELDFKGQEFPRPPWLGQEVTDNKAYSNYNLAMYGWPPEEA